MNFMTRVMRHVKATNAKVECYEHMFLDPIKVTIHTID